MEGNNETESSAANINDLIHFVTYNFEVNNRNDENIDGQPCTSLHDIEVALSSSQQAIYYFPTSPSLIENQTISQTGSDDIILCSDEEQNNHDELILTDNNNDIMLSPEIETEITEQFLRGNPLPNSDDNMNNNGHIDESDNNLQIIQNETDVENSDFKTTLNKYP